MADLESKLIFWRGRRAFYRRRVPALYAEVDPRESVKIALKTSDAVEARAKVAAIDQQIFALWEARLMGRDGDAGERAAAIRRIAQSHGFKSIPAADLAGDVAAILERVNYLVECGLQGDPDAVEALLVAPAVPSLKLPEELLEFFFKFTQDRVQGKTERQVRRWRNPRRLVVTEFHKVIGDITLAQITRDHMLKYRAYLMDLVVAEELQAESANKRLSQLSNILETVSLARGEAPPPVKDLALAVGLENRRAPYPVEFIRNAILKPGRLDGLNEQARAVLLAMIETGLRLVEVVNIRPEHIVLDHAIPHVQIRRTKERDLKTPHSERDVPLVGVSLAAFQAHPGGFPRYYDNEASASATINKYLLENDLRPGEGLSLYSFRHSFEDRLIVAGADERMRSELMGHKYDRPKYGEGPSLEMKLKLLEAIEIVRR